MSLMDIIVQATDQASSVIQGIQQNTENATGKMNISFMAVGAGIAGAGLAMEGLARSQQNMTTSVDKLSASTGLTTTQIRNMAMAVADANVPLEDATGLIQLASKNGLEGADAIQKYSEFWAKVGKATGESAVELAKGGLALQSIGIDAGHSEQALAALGYISTKTNADMGEVFNLISEFGPNLQKMGLGINETAAVMGILTEKGMNAEIMSMKFSQAVDGSGGSLQTMLSTLGITNEQLASHTSQVQGSAGAIDKQAEAVDKNTTFMQKAKQAMEELTFKYGDQIGVMGDFSGVLTGIGSALTIASTLKGIFAGATVASTIATVAQTAATWALNGAMAVLFSPITLIVVAIAGLIAIGVLLYKNWDTIKEFGMKIFGAIGDFFSNIFDSMADKAKWFGGIFKTIFSLVGDIVLTPYRLVAAGINFVIEAVNKIKFTVPDWVPLIGGKGISFNIPTIPKFHTTGVFRADMAGGEGLAMLKDGERIIHQDATFGGGNSGGNSRPIDVTLILDGEVLVRRLVNPMGEALVSKIRGGTGVLE